MEILSLILSGLATIGVSFSGIFMLRQNKQLKAQEVKKAEQENAFAVAERFQKLLEISEEKCSAQSDKIEDQWKMIGDLRDQLSDKAKEETRLKIEIMHLTYGLCTVDECNKRKPIRAFQDGKFQSAVTQQS